MSLVKRLVREFNTRSFGKGTAAQKVWPLAYKHEVHGSIPAESACVLSLINYIYMSQTPDNKRSGTRYTYVCMYACVYIRMCVWLCGKI